MTLFVRIWPLNVSSDLSIVGTRDESHVGLVKVDGSMDPVDTLHVSQPDVFSGLASPDSEAD